MKAKFLTPVVTAFNEYGKLDYQANQNIYDHLINGGIDGIVLMGSTGEFFTMSMEQKKELILLATSYIDKRVPLLIGTSCMAASDTIELANFAHENGADGVLSYHLIIFHFLTKALNIILMLLLKIVKQISICITFLTEQDMIFHLK